MIGGKMSEVSKRRQRLRDKAPLGLILQKYGYDVTANGGVQQFKCDLHGDGNDGSPSARFYGQDSWYCFACGKSRDVVSTVMEKEGLEYKTACLYLEKMFGLPSYDWEEDKPTQITDAFNVNSFYNQVDTEERVYKILLNRTKDRSIGKEESLKYWEAFDMLKANSKVTEAHWQKLLTAIND